MKDKHLRAFMQTAKTFAECSTAVRAKVGAILVKDDRIISIGYNGMPSGWDNECEYREYSWENKTPGLSMEQREALYPLKDEDHPAGRNGHFRLITRPEVLHAEANALAKVARSSESSEGAYLFVTYSPCMDCAKLIYQSGIKKVYYDTQYRDTKGLEFLSKCDVEVEQLND